MKILIADDDPEIVRVLSTALWGLGFEPVPASDAMQVLLFAQKHKPDAILLDINMPAGSGVDVLRRLKASNRTCAIPVIVLSATADAAVPATVRSLGAAEFYAKPFDLAALLLKLREVLGQSGAPSKKNRSARPVERHHHPVMHAAFTAA